MASHRTSTGLQQEEEFTQASTDVSGTHQDSAETTSSMTPTRTTQIIPLHGATQELDFDHPDSLCFFYGTLMDSGNIASVLDLTEEPKLTPAHIHGYRTMMNGPFPALVPAEQSSAVYGMVYRIEYQEEMKEQIAELENYEGEDYGRERVPLRFEKGPLRLGWTFVWVGDKEELGEGTWDFEDWKTRWGRGARLVSESPPIDRYVVEDCEGEDWVAGKENGEQMNKD
ncbi:MAG: hypothetical protein Q9180_004904 [Flavoplaca navasiana]